MTDEVVPKPNAGVFGSSFTGGSSLGCGAKAGTSETEAWKLVEVAIQDAGQVVQDAFWYLRDQLALVRQELVQIQQPAVYAPNSLRAAEVAHPGMQSVTVEYAAEHMEPHALVIDFEHYEELQRELHQAKAQLSASVLTRQVLDRIKVLEARQDKIRAVLDGGEDS